MIRKNKSYSNIKSQSDYNGSKSVYSLFNSATPKGKKSIVEPYLASFSINELRSSVKPKDNFNFINYALTTSELKNSNFMKKSSEIKQMLTPSSNMNKTSSASFNSFNSFNVSNTRNGPKTNLSSLNELNAFTGTKPQNKILNKINLLIDSASIKHSNGIDFKQISFPLSKDSKPFLAKSPKKVSFAKSNHIDDKNFYSSTQFRKNESQSLQRLEEDTKQRKAGTKVSSKNLFEKYSAKDSADNYQNQFKDEVTQSLLHKTLSRNEIYKK